MQLPHFTGYFEIFLFSIENALFLINIKKGHAKAQALSTIYNFSALSETTSRSFTGATKTSRKSLQPQHKVFFAIAIS